MRAWELPNNLSSKPICLYLSALSCIQHFIYSQNPSLIIIKLHTVAIASTSKPLFFKSCSEDALLLMTFVLRTLRISALLQLLVVGFFPKFSLPQVSLNNLFVIASARKPVKSGDKTPSFHYFKYDLIQLFHPFHIIKNFHSL